MLARFVRIALVSVGLLSFGVSAEAAFSVATMFTVNGSSVLSLTRPDGLTFTASPLMVTNNTSDPISYNFVQVEKSGQAANVDVTFTVNGTLTVVNNGASTGMGFFSQTFRYTLDASGTGTLIRTASSFPTLVGGILFTPAQYATPTVTAFGPGLFSRGNISTTAQQGAVPEPASVVMVGLGLAGLGGLALRRRRSA